MPTRPIFGEVIDPNSAANRQRLIKNLQDELHGTLLVYTANPGHPFGLIMRQDVLPFEDLLRTSDSDVGYLMITSPGGDPNAAEKLLFMCRERFKMAFYTIIPDYAKSAATMVALGGDKILMGYLAELGPVDPQLQLTQTPGPSVPARSFIDGLENIRSKIKDDGDPVQMYYPMLQQIKPELIATCQSAIEDSKAFVEKWLKRYMLKNNPEQAGKVAQWLSEGKKYRSHGKVIDYSEAKKVLKLNVEKLDPSSNMWGIIWELYVRSIHALQQTNGVKLFESANVSVTMHVEAKAMSPPESPRRVRQPQPQTAPPTKESLPQEAQK